MERRRAKGGSGGAPLGSLSNISLPVSSQSAQSAATGTRDNSHKRRQKTIPRCGLIVFVLSVLLSLFAIHTGTRTRTATWGRLDDYESSRNPDRNLPTTNEACRGYRGILHIAQGDAEGAAGTVFFLFVLNQLLYAQEYNLIPWIHLNNVSHHVFDAKVHGSALSTPLVVSALVKPSWLGFQDPIAQKSFGYPGPPPKATSSLGTRSSQTATVTVTGNGVWDSYFQPVSDFSPSDPSCRQLPLVRLSYPQIIPGLHLNCPWSLRAWRYGGLPPSLRNDSATYSEWFRPMRQRGSRMVKKYIKFHPYMLKEAQHANPSSRCLAVHVRHSDKANRRQKIPLKRFYPYIDAYLEQAPQGKVFLATDSSVVLQELQSLPQYQDRILWQEGAARSQNTTSVFRQHDHHYTNVQVLVDILAMSHCQFLLHGLSAVSEAVLYLNPALQSHNHSVNLELPKRTNVPDFFRYVQNEVLK
jgi:hypothetical protein